MFDWLKRAYEALFPRKMAPARPPSMEATIPAPDTTFAEELPPEVLAAIARIRKAQAHELPALVTKQRVDENGGPVFINGQIDRTVGVIDGGKWRPLTAIERAILERSDQIRTQGGGGPGEEK